MNPEEVVPNEQLRRARILKGWSQAELAERLGTSFEMVSRWERGIAFPSLYYRERLCATLEATAEELGLVRRLKESLTQLPSPFIFLASSHVDAEKTIVSRLKSALQERGFTLLSSRQLGRQETDSARTTLREVTLNALAVFVIISPETRSSRHVREALAMASRYKRPVCGVWIEGEDWREYLPEDHRELAALIDARKEFDAALSEAISVALKRVGLQSSATAMTAPDGANTGVMPLPALPPSTPEPAMPTQQRTRHLSRKAAVLLIGLAVLVITGGILGSRNLLTHFTVLHNRSGVTTLTPVRGGIWRDDFFGLDIDSLIPNGSVQDSFLPLMVDQALYLPLFYGDAQGVIHPGATTEIPSIQNGGMSSDFKTWTFHLRRHLVWSDGQPYDARDVDYSWKTWVNPKFRPANVPVWFAGFLIRSADVSADHLTISFHLKQAYAPFLSQWVDGIFAPLPAHHFSRLPAEQILTSPDNLNPTVTSGPFMIEESQSGDHYTLVRNPRYYRASEGLPYLDKVVFHIVANEDAVLKDLQAGTIDSAWHLDVSRRETYQQLAQYTLTPTPTSSTFEALYFNFHNTILASHREVRQAMAMAIDYQALIRMARHGLADQLCTDHGSALHPGYQPDAPCPEFNPAAANKLLDDNGWVKGPDGVRLKGGQRLEFEYSIPTGRVWRSESEAIIERNFKAIGIQLDIQNYPASTLFNSFLPQGKASPPTGAVAGRYDIAEYQNTFGYDPDDAYLLACDQLPPTGQNVGFYCNPALDALFKQEQRLADPDVRQQIFVQIHQIYLTEFPFITLYSPLDIAMVRRGTHNYQVSPIEGGTINLWEWWCDSGRC